MSMYRAQLTHLSNCMPEVRSCMNIVVYRVHHSHTISY
jgi:hypothetical protein